MADGRGVDSRIICLLKVHMHQEVFLDVMMHWFPTSRQASSFPPVNGDKKDGRMVLQVI